MIYFANLFYLLDSKYIITLCSLLNEGGGYLFLVVECDPAVHFQCPNGICIHKDQYCNGINDCGDFADEEARCGKLFIGYPYLH